MIVVLVTFRAHSLVQLSGPGCGDGDEGLLGDSDVLGLSSHHCVGDVLGKHRLTRHKPGYVLGLRDEVRHALCVDDGDGLVNRRVVVTGRFSSIVDRNRLVNSFVQPLGYFSAIIRANEL